MMIPKRRPANKNKVYVDTWVFFNKETGIGMPTHFKLENGLCFKIDKVLIRKRAPANIAGGQGFRHDVLAHPMLDAEASEPPPQSEFHLFFDAPYWFLEVDDDWKV